MRLVAAAQASGSRTQALADRAAAILFYVAVVAGAITFTYWWFSGDTEHALIRTATVLIIACPHALGLAIPLVIAISTSLGAQNGLLVKDRLALEGARALDMVIFDKTGTLTRGFPRRIGSRGCARHVRRRVGRVFRGGRVQLRTSACQSYPRRSRALKLDSIASHEFRSAVWSRSEGAGEGEDRRCRRATPVDGGQRNGAASS
jgi:E1-E2 ATPase